MILGIILFLSSRGDLVIDYARFDDSKTCSSVIEQATRRLQTLQHIEAFGQCFDVRLGLPVTDGINGDRSL